MAMAIACLRLLTLPPLPPFPLLSSPCLNSCMTRPEVFLWLGDDLAIRLLLALCPSPDSQRKLTLEVPQNRTPRVQLWADGLLRSAPITARRGSPCCGSSCHAVPVWSRSRRPSPASFRACRARRHGTCLPPPAGKFRPSLLSLWSACSCAGVAADCQISKRPLRAA